MKKNNKMGFLLIEWMMHFLLLSILFLVVAELIMSWHKNVMNMGRLCDGALSIFLAADALRRDVHNATTIKHDTKGIHLGCCHTALVWQYIGNAIWRQQSIYEQGSWSKPFKSLFAKHISQSSFIVSPLFDNYQGVSLVTWKVNEDIFLFCSRNGLVV